MNYDLIVIGAGPGGYTAAIKAAMEGLNVALVEKDQVGGTCLNRGCIPTKALVHSAESYQMVKNLEAEGIDVSDVKINLEKMLEKKDAVVSKLRDGISALLKANKITVIKGTAVVSSPNTVSVSSEEAVFEITGGNILLAVGASPVPLTVPGGELAVNSDSLLTGSHLLYQLNSVAIVGGGVIGCEFAGIFSQLGKSVTIIEAADRILPAMDRELSQSLAMIFKKRGITIHTGASVTEIKKNDGYIAVSFTSKAGEHEVICDNALVSVGRRADTSALFTEGARPRLDRGHIVINERFETSIPGMYAIGDCTGGISLAHYASAQATAVVETILGEDVSVDLSTVPTCVYTNPEIASVGITADEAKAKGISVKMGKFPMAQNGRTLIEGAGRSMIKTVFDAKTGVILGAQLICPRATDLITTLALAVSSQMTEEQLKKVIYAHPTFSEGIGEAVENAFGRSIHTLTV